MDWLGALSSITHMNLIRCAREFTPTWSWLMLIFCDLRIVLACKKLAGKFQITRISQFVTRFKHERIRQGVIAKMPCWRISMWICWCILNYLLIYVFNFARIILIRAIIQNQMHWMLWWTFCWPTARKMTHITLRPLTILCHSIPNSG